MQSSEIKHIAALRGGMIIMNSFGSQADGGNLKHSLIQVLWVT
jgi:hypothetical protein